MRHRPHLPPSSSAASGNARLEDLLRSGSARLITLIGPGGIGKTGPAAEATRRIHRAEPDRPLYGARPAELDATAAWN
ncbi:hypothetical protein [Nocardia testacea]|uniref:hypothetical protein n=1 Tax=Nocardia testacea TaxID=248551 RepID=UPI003A83F33B